MPDARPNRHRTKPGCSPDAACFPAVRFSLRRRRKGWCLCTSCPSRRAPVPIFQSHFFDGWKQTGAEREPGQGRAVCARSSERTRRPLTRLPRSEHSSAKKWQISPALFFSTRLRAFAARLLGSNPESRIFLFSRLFSAGSRTLTRKPPIFRGYPAQFADPAGVNVR